MQIKGTFYVGVKLGFVGSHRVVNGRTFLDVVRDVRSAMSFDSVEDIQALMRKVPEQYYAILQTNVMV